MIDIKNKKIRGRSAPAKKPKKSPVVFQFSEGMLPLAMLGFSVVTLGMSVYGISSGQVQQYALNHKNDQVAYASEQTAPNQVSSEPLSKGADASSDDTMVNVEDTGLSAEEQAVIIKYREAIRDKVVIAEHDAKIEAEKEAANKVEAEKVAEQERVEAEKLAIKEKASSMRLRIQPDRDLGDIYYYVVEAGDTLASLSQHFNLSMGQLMEENHIEQANHIYTGEVIFMPAGYAPVG